MVICYSGKDGNNRDSADLRLAARVGGASGRAAGINASPRRVALVRVWQCNSRCPVQPLSPLSPCRPINRHEDPNPRLLDHFLTDDGDDGRFAAQQPHREATARHQQTSTSWERKSDALCQRYASIVFRDSSLK